MRALLGLALLLMIMPASAQTTVSEDDEGDATRTIVAAGDPRPYPYLDLTSLSMSEEQDGFTFVLGVADLDPQDHESILKFGEFAYRTYFTFQEADYRIEVSRFPAASGDVVLSARLEVHDAGFGEYLTVERLEVEGDLAEDTLTVQVARDLLVGKDGSTPTKGMALTDFWAESFEEFDADFFGVGAPALIEGEDRMPDEGVADFVWDTVYGLEQTGHARLESEQPYRVSNGEATTFLYEILAINTGDEDDSFRFAASDGPEGWVVTFPEKRIEIDAGEAEEVPVLVTVPFNHQHGTSKSILVEMSSQTDPGSVGRLELGVRYTSVPQPAGHHDELFLHMQTGDNFAPGGADIPFFRNGQFNYFNTLQDDELDSGGAIEPTFASCSATEMEYYYRISLSPGLQMGLDFDTDREGTLEFTLEAPLPATDVKVRGELHRRVGADSFFRFPGQPVQEGEETLLATIPATTPESLDMGDTMDYSLPITPTEFSDYVPYVAEARMELDLYITETRPTLFFCAAVPDYTPKIQPGARFTLPLDEYHDDVDDYFQALSSVDLLAEDTQKRFVNPGGTALFNVTATHTGNEGGKYHLELSGSNVEWAKVVGDTTFEIHPGDTRDLFIAVTAPADAADGQLADVTLHAVKDDDANVRTVLRLLTEVDEEETHHDATEQVEVLAQGDDKNTPGVPVAALLVGLGLLALRRRP